MISRLDCVLAAIRRIEVTLARLSACEPGRASPEPMPFDAALTRACVSHPPLAGAPAAAGGHPKAIRQDIARLIRDAATRFHLDPALLHAVIKAESNYNPVAVSPAGACGLMQLMPTTARTLGVSDIFDPWQNISAGARYLREQLDRFGDIELALAAYNAGPTAVSRYAPSGQSRGGIPPFPETRAYVSRVMGYWRAIAAGRRP